MNVMLGLALLGGTLGCHWHDKPFPEALGDGSVGRSNLTIPPQQTFELGGGHAGALRVRLANVGPATVEVLSADGGVVSVARGDTADADFGPGEKARLRNPTNQRARLKVVYTQDPEDTLPMRYVDLPTEP